MNVDEKYELNEAERKFECERVFMGEGTKTPEDFWKVHGEDPHPGVDMVLAQKPVNLAGKIKVLSESHYPKTYAREYMRSSQSRKNFEERGWSTVATLQLRNPIYRSHEYLAKIAIEVCDGVFIHSLVGNLKSGDIPAEWRIKCINTLINGYFVEKNVVYGSYPMDMRYAGPREALLHATFRQNFGVSHTIIGCDHAGVGDYHSMFEAQTIFDKIPDATEACPTPAWPLICKPLKIDWTFYCLKCDGMASLRTCPHIKEDRVIISGTKLRNLLSEGGDVPDHFGRDEVLVILREYYASLIEKVEIKMHKAAAS